MMTKTHGRFAVVWMCFGLMFLVGCSGPSKTTPKFAVNQRWTHEVKVVSRMILPIGVPNADTKETSFRLDCQVQPGDRAGETQVQATIQALSASMNSLGKKYQYDSAVPSAAVAAGDDDKEAQRQQQFAGIFRELLGQNYVVVLDARGAIKNLTGLAPPLATLAQKMSGGTFGGEQAAMVFYEGSLRDYVTPGVFAAMPKGALEPNVPWTHDEWLRAPLAAPVPIQKNYQLDHWEKTPGRDIAVITYSVTASEEQLKAVAAKPAGDLVIVAVEGKGTIRYAINEGCVDSWEEVIRAQVRSQQTASASRDKPERNKIFYVINKQVKRQSL